MAIRRNKASQVAAAGPAVPEGKAAREEQVATVAASRSSSSSLRLPLRSASPRTAETAETAALVALVETAAQAETAGGKSIVAKCSTDPAQVL